MRCRKARWYLSARCDGTLSERQRARLDEHLEHCAGCRREAFYFSEISNLASRLEPVSVRPDFNLRLRAAVERQESIDASPRPWLRFSFSPVWRPAVAAAAVLLLFVLTYGGYRMLHSPAVGNRAGVAENAADWAWSDPDQLPGEALSDGFAVPSGWTPVDGQAPDAQRVRNRYLAARPSSSDFVLGTVSLDDPTAKKPEPLYVMPVIRSDQVVRKVSY